MHGGLPIGIPAQKNLTQKQQKVQRSNKGWKSKLTEKHHIVCSVWCQLLTLPKFNSSSQKIVTSPIGYRNFAGTKTTLGCKNHQRSHAQQVEVTYFLCSQFRHCQPFFFRNTSSRFTSFSKVTPGSNCTNCGIHTLLVRSFPQNCEESWGALSSWRSCMLKNKDATIFHQLLLVGGIWRSLKI